MSKKLSLMIAIGLCACALEANAAGLIAPNMDLRQDLAWLSDRGVISLSLSTWPMSQEEIESSLASARPSTARESHTIARIQQQLLGLKTNAFVSAQASTGNQEFPHAFAQSSYSDQSLSLGGRYSADNVDVRLQGNVEGNQQIADHSRVNVQGSYAAVKAWNQWLSVGQVSQWWGPGYDGSLIRSDAARPVTGLILQRADQSPFETRWLSWMGRWQYQLSAGQLAQYQSVPNAKLLGARFTMSPTPYLELGASRVIQWGGEGRPQSLSSLFDAITGTRDNFLGTGHDPANQLGEFDFKLKLQPLVGLPSSIYGQLTGEDESGGLPSKHAYLLGLEGHSIWDNIGAVNWHLEGVNTFSEQNIKNIMYRHGTYKDGYYQQGYPLGHALGGDGKMISGAAEVVLYNGHRLNTRLFYAQVNAGNQTENQAFPKSDTLKGFSVGWSGIISTKLKLGTTMWYTQGKHDSDAGVAINLELPIN
ncbi:MAG TPA: capsule assembly Wzi family protein [Aquirhabdus sp.]